MTPNGPSDRLSDDEQLWILLDRYLAGEAPGEEVEAVHRWLAANPKHGIILSDLRKIREVAEDAPPHRSVEGAWKRQLFQLGQPDSVSERDLAEPAVERQAGVPRFIGIQPRLRFSWIAVAAAIGVVAVGITTTLVRHRTGGPSRGDSVGEPRVFASMAGQRAVFRLVDGTQVILAPASRLIVPVDFGSGRRELTLEGEAYFDAVHDAARPLLVRVRDAVVHDLGTRFAVRGYSSDSLVQVVVTQGRVQLRPQSAPSGSGALLDQGMMAQINAAGASTVRTSVDTTRYVAWTAGTLVFVSASIREMAHEIERWYDIEVRLLDSALAERRITATLDDQPLSHLLDQLSVSLHVRAKRAGRIVTLTPFQHVPSRPAPVPAAPVRDPEGALP